MEGAGDLDKLALGDGEGRHDGFRTEGGAEALKDAPAAFLHGAAVDHAALGRLPAEIDVLRHAQVGQQAEFLIDDRDAVLAGDMRVGDVHDLAVDQDLPAGIGMVGPRQHLHQRALAGAVLAHQGLDLSAPGLELNVAESLRTGKSLGNAAHLQGRRTRTLCRRVERGRSHGFLRWKFDSLFF